MNKNYLEALENMKNGASDWYGSYELCEDYPVVKSALERLKSIDQSNPSKVLEVFKEFKKILLENVVLLDTDLQRLNAVENYILKAQEQEKVLKILFEKKVELMSLYLSSSVEQYNNQFVRDENKLTQEEFDLIKEWIECLKNLRL